MVYLIILLAVVCFYCFLCKIIEKNNYYTQKHVDSFFVASIGFISVLPILIYASKNSVSVNKLKFLFVFLFIVSLFIAETVVFSIRLKKDGDSLSAWIKRKTSALHKEKITDEEAEILLSKISKTNADLNFSSIPLEKKEKIIVSAYKKGVSVYQISRIMKIPKHEIKKVLKKKKY